MGTFVKVASVGELKDGEMREVVVNGYEILLARLGNRYYAVAARCSHMGGRLALGKLEGTVVTCPLHGSQFDLADGRVVRWLRGSGVFSAMVKVLKKPKPIRTYRVKVADDSVLVEA